MAAIASARQRHAEQAAGEAERQHLQQVDRDDLARCGAPTHFSTAMLRIFCCTNTRVTLDTAMPPRITMTRPTRLR